LPADDEDMADLLGSAYTLRSCIRDLQIA
jgi:hypothetical protein